MSGANFNPLCYDTSCRASPQRAPPFANSHILLHPCGSAGIFANPLKALKKLRAMNRLLEPNYSVNIGKSKNGM